MELEEPSDLYAIHQLKSRYFRYMDTKAWDSWRLLFTEDVEIYFDNSVLPKDTAPVQAGRDNFVAFVSRMLQTAVTVHHGHMPDIEFTGPHHATGVWAMYDWVDDAEKGYAFQGWGHYHERYRKEADGIWRISQMRLTRIRTDVIESTRPAGERPWPTPWNPDTPESQMSK
jgi:hypothetical protein